MWQLISITILLAIIQIISSEEVRASNIQTEYHRFKRAMLTNRGKEEDFEMPNFGSYVGKMFGPYLDAGLKIADGKEETGLQTIASTYKAAQGAFDAAKKGLRRISGIFNTNEE